MSVTQDSPYGAKDAAIEGAKRGFYIAVIGLFIGAFTGWMAISIPEPSDAASTIETGFWALVGVTALAFAVQGRLLINHEPEVLREQRGLSFFVSNALVGAFVGLALFSVAFVQVQTVFGGADGSLWMPAVWEVIKPASIGAHAGVFALIVVIHTLGSRSRG